MVGVLHTQHLLLAAGAGVTGSRLKYADLYDFFTGSGVRTALAVAAGIAELSAPQAARLMDIASASMMETNFFIQFILLARSGLLKASVSCRWM